LPLCTCFRRLNRCLLIISVRNIRELDVGVILHVYRLCLYSLFLFFYIFFVNRHFTYKQVARSTGIEKAIDTTIEGLQCELAKLFQFIPVSWSTHIILAKSSVYAYSSVARVKRSKRNKKKGEDRQSERPKIKEGAARRRVREGRDEGTEKARVRHRIE
jgi:ribosomal protein L44E